jgi:hypothetical protein
MIAMFYYNQEQKDSMVYRQMSNEARHLLLNLLK